MVASNAVFLYTPCETLYRWRSITADGVIQVLLGVLTAYASAMYHLCDGGNHGEIDCYRTCVLPFSDLHTADHLYSIMLAVHVSAHRLPLLVFTAEAMLLPGLYLNSRETDYAKWVYVGFMMSLNIAMQVLSMWPLRFSVWMFALASSAALALLLHVYSQDDYKYHVGWHVFAGLAVIAGYKLVDINTKPRSEGLTKRLEL
jgi:hypothetical protein